MSVQKKTCPSKASGKPAYLDVNGLPADFVRMSSFEVRELLHVLRSCFVRLLKPLCPFYIWRQVQTRIVIWKSSLMSAAKMHEAQYDLEYHSQVSSLMIWFVPLPASLSATFNDAVKCNQPRESRVIKSYIIGVCTVSIINRYGFWICVCLSCLLWSSDRVTVCCLKHGHDDCAVKRCKRLCVIPETTGDGISYPVQKRKKDPSYSEGPGDNWGKNLWVLIKWVSDDK